MREVDNKGAHPSDRAVTNFIENEAHDLLEIALDYARAAKSGMLNGRRIRPELAKAYAREFNARADALFLIAEQVTTFLASGTEAQRAATPKSDAVHDGPVANGETPISNPNTHTKTGTRG